MSHRGPAGPYDDGWKNVGPDEEATLFFNSNISWYNVWWTAPAGNKFYNLAHQYMAAKLNVTERCFQYCRSGRRDRRR